MWANGNDAVAMLIYLSDMWGDGVCPWANALSFNDTKVFIYVTATLHLSVVEYHRACMYL